MTRTRSREWSHLFPAIELSIDNNVNDTTGATKYSYPEFLFTRFNTMTDAVTPGFFKDIREGRTIKVNHMTQDKFLYFQVSQGQGCTWTTVHSPTQTSQVVLNQPIGYQALSNWYPTTSWTNIINRAMSTYGFTSGGSPFLGLRSQSDLAQEAVARARTTGMDVGTFAAEFGKTVNMIRSLAQNVLKRANTIIRSVGRGNPDMTAAAFSEAWLEYRYGWRTLAYDIEDVNTALEKLKEGLHFKSRAYAFDEAKLPWAWSDPNGTAMRSPRTAPSSNNRSTIVCSAMGECVATRRAGALVELVLDEFAFIDPLTTGWEVIPFSFIVDWFTNIGNLVSAWSPFMSGQLGGLWVSERVDVTRVFEAQAVPYWLQPDESSVSGDTYGVVRLRSKTYERTPLAEIPFNISFRLNLDFSKLVDVAALVVTRYLGILRKLTPNTRL